MASHQSKITAPREQELQVEKAGSISPPGRGTRGGVRGPPARHSPLRRVLVQPPRFDGGRERGGGGGAFHAVAERAGAAAGESGSGQARAGTVVTPAAATAGDEEPREGVKSWRFAGGGGQARPRHTLRPPLALPRGTGNASTGCLRARTLVAVPLVGVPARPPAPGTADTRIPALGRGTGAPPGPQPQIQRRAELLSARARTHARTHTPPPHRVLTVCAHTHPGKPCKHEKS